ncbi:MAG: NAD-dependent epimerase/dehydratase family protein [Kofleriaceae bacterium]|nr:NAD-dependent epimerase/dehydratase family protein [Kofleriaceae bacterium]MBP9168374.1 NAD-dependent epimerase/dehydratase family protein [Kofleriaceae bacterium]MBP9857253.1 NAD-dependent epimerase/dehydratase family protein [Kofleriaceae bacterium]
MKILMTGAGGQIGSDLITALVAQGHTIVATDLKPRPSTAAVTWRGLDVVDPVAVDRVIGEEAPEVVYHLAAILSATGEKNPALAYAVNQTGTWNVLEACRTRGVRQLLFCSSIAVYGPGLPDPTPDDVALRPTTMYGVTKAAGEMLCEYYRAKRGLDCRGVRFPGLISASLPGGGSTDYALFMYVDGVRVGSYQAFARADTRVPLMYMPDGVRALLELAAAPADRLTRAIYNIAGFSPRADEIAASVGRAVPGVAITYQPDPLRQGILDSWPRALDDTCARRDWGWAPRYTLDQMTEDLVPKIRELLSGGARLAH